MKTTNDLSAAPPTSPAPETTKPAPAAASSEAASARASSHATVATEAYGVARDIGLPQLPDAMEEAASGLGRVMKFADHLFGDEQVAENGAARVAVAVANTIADTLAERAFDGAISDTFGGGAGAAAAVLGAADGLFDVDDAPKLLTAIAAELDPAAVASGAADLLADVGVAALTATRDGDAARQQLERVGEAALRGEYGAVMQGASMMGHIVADPEEATERLTGMEASRGDYGVLVAWGNAAGDMWTGGADAPPRIVPVEEAERRETFLGALFG